MSQRIPEGGDIDNSGFLLFESQENLQLQIFVRHIGKLANWAKIETDLW